MEPILATFWTNFGLLLRAILVLKSAPEGNQKWDHFWKSRLRISEVREMPEQELNKSGEKGAVTGIILAKRRGGTN